MTATTAQVATPTPAHHHEITGEGLALLALAGLLWFIGWRVSLRIHPYTACKVCKGNPRDYGAIYRGSFSQCSACAGSGKQLRHGTDVAGPPDPARADRRSQNVS